MALSEKGRAQAAEREANEKYETLLAELVSVSL